MRTLQDEIKRTSLLTNDNEQQLTNKSNPPKKANKQLESLTRYDIEELMGVRRPRYTRRNGAIRQK